ncbi:MAG: response regulator [Chloroflexi bacterium]|nr:response regulator [Chloroflexota bacterium]
MSRILIVDDDEVLVKTLAAIFRRSGHTVLAALDGEAGLACARAGNPDLIILDVMMPEMDGLEVCRLLRSEPQTRGIPVLMFTALDEPDMRARAGLDPRRQGVQAYLEDEILADDYVTKPVIVDDLLRRVNTLLWIGDVIEP